MNWYLHVLKNYAVFKGRARRKEYWFFILISFIVAFVLSFADQALNTPGASEGSGLLGAIYSLAVLFPTIPVGVRRLHDTGRTGWWMLIVLLPIIGALVLLYFFVLDSQPGSNEYGDNPKEGQIEFE